MQFYSMQTTGDQATLELREAAIPDPGPQQVLVQMRAAGLNRGEFIVGHGLQKAGTAKAIGMEGAGEVVKLAAGVSFGKNVKSEARLFAASSVMA